MSYWGLVRTVAFSTALLGSLAGCSTAGLGIAAAGVAVDAISAIGSASGSGSEKTSLAQAAKAVGQGPSKACLETLSKARTRAAAQAGVRANVPVAAGIPGAPASQQRAPGRVQRDCGVRPVCVPGAEQPVEMLVCRGKGGQGGAPDPGYILPNEGGGPAASWGWREATDEELSAPRTGI